MAKATILQPMQPPIALELSHEEARALRTLFWYHVNLSVDARLDAIRHALDSVDVGTFDEGFGSGVHSFPRGSK